MSRHDKGDDRARGGFSFVELVMAIIVLAFGVLGLATTTLMISRELTLAEATTVRTAALQSVIERIRALPYDSVGAGVDTIGPTTISWTTSSTSGQTKSVRIVSVGPGLSSASASQPSPMMSNSVADTILYVVLRP